MGACDANGVFVDSQRVIAVLLRHLINGRGWTGGVARTVSTTRMLDKLCAKHGLPITETPVGFARISEIMLSEDILIGGEEGGGIGFKNHLPERDGVLAGLLLLEAMAFAGKSLAGLVDDLHAEVGFHAYTRSDLHPSPEKMPRIIAHLQGLKPAEFAGETLQSVTRKDGTLLTFSDASWLLLRSSGTEPVVRVYAEAGSRERVDILIAAGAALIESV